MICVQPTSCSVGFHVLLEFLGISSKIKHTKQDEVQTVSRTCAELVADSYEDDPWFWSHCGSAAALQERFDREQQSAATETDGSAGANGVSDVTGRGEEPAAEGASDRLEQVTVTPVLRNLMFHSDINQLMRKVVQFYEVSVVFLLVAVGGSAGANRETASRWVLVLFITFLELTSCFSRDRPQDGLGAETSL